MNHLLFTHSHEKDWIDVETYHVMLRSLARKGRWEEFIFVWKAMAKDGMEPTVACYAAFYQCLGKSQRSQNVKQTT